MSKNVLIQEGGESVTLENVRRIETDLAEGGRCGWLPEDEIRGVVASVVDTTLVLSGSDVSVFGNAMRI